MKWSIIATWKMAYEGVCIASEMLENSGKAKDAIIKAINNVEENVHFHSVGNGGLPNEEGVVQCDAGYMEGDSLRYGAVGALENVIHAVDVAKACSKDRFNNLLVGEGANKFAKKMGMPNDDLSCPEAMERYEKRKNELSNLSSYNGHDTVGMIMLDQNKNMCAATSTSGLFMKKWGRVGDSPIVGSGYYCDDEVGGACATGVGEEIMRGCLSYEIVSKMKFGLDPQTAASQTVYEFSQRMIQKKGYADAISTICMNNQGEIGIGTNVEFAFVCANENSKAKIYIAKPKDEEVIIQEYNNSIVID